MPGPRDVEAILDLLREIERELADTPQDSLRHRELQAQRAILRARIDHLAVTRKDEPAER